MLSPKNKNVKRLKRLASTKKTRYKERVFLVEGLVLLREAISSGLTVEEVFFTEDLEKETMGEFSFPDSVGLHLVAEKTLKGALGTVNPQGTVALCSMPEKGYDTIFSNVDDGLLRPLVVLVDVRDPGNVGTLLRTAEASGAAGVIMAGNTVDVYSPKVVRSAAGSLFRLPVFSESDPAQVLALLSEKGWQTLATVAPSSDPSSVVHDYTKIDITQSAFFLGNEAHGLTQEVVQACDERITIPMAEAVESLNIAAAGAIICFEARRQYRAVLPK